MWQFTLTNGNHVFNIEAHTLDGGDLDSGFNFQWSTGSSGPWTTMLTVTKTVDAGPTSLHVGAIQVSTVNAARGFKHGRALVTIVDDQGNRVSGADVTVTFSGDYSESVPMTTGPGGVADLTTAATLKGSISFTACVDGVVDTVLPYISADNLDTCAGL